ncbi:MAG TPA: cupin domain-containing protein [Solirubrobacteraceae bacterium]|nr:cupin domain-containing protein [Solirubrobacteraceae bacterium]
MKRLDVFADTYEWDESDPDGYRGGVINITKALGAQALMVKAFVLPPAQTLCPYHYEYEEEWLIVLEGTLVLRTPGGEEEVGSGDVVAFPAGPEGAHQVSNRSGSDARLVMFSSAREPSVAVYPDSDKIGVWPGNEADTVMLRRADGNVDYYDGER